jgi:hypothetical protein
MVIARATTIAIIIAIIMTTLGETAVSETITAAKFAR